MMDAIDSQGMHAGTPDLAGVARLLADGTRASFCLALLDGWAWSAAELARHAGVAASTAIGHLNLLVVGGLLDWEHGPALTGDGARWLTALGIALPPATRRPLVRSCLDWTERRPHLAGTVGAALCAHAFGSGWITRIGTGRAVALTDAGRNALQEHLGLISG